MKRISARFSLLIVTAVMAPWMAAAAQGITLLLVPREEVPVRLGLDIAARQPTLLLSYKGMSDGSFSLHGWSGREWVRVTPASYAEGSFFPKPPESAVVVWSDEDQLPDALIPAQEWCPQAYVISTTELRPLIHLLGRHYDFKYDDWKWFSDHYKLAIDRINPYSLNMAWYHRRLGENLRKSTISGEDDLAALSVLYGDAPALPAQSAAPADAAVEGDETPVDGDGESAFDDNPLTNSIPQAVILGAEEANETAMEESPGTVAETGSTDESE